MADLSRMYRYTYSRGLRFRVQDKLMSILPRHVKAYALRGVAANEKVGAPYP